MLFGCGHGCSRCTACCTDHASNFSGWMQKLCKSCGSCVMIRSVRYRTCHYQMCVKDGRCRGSSPTMRQSRRGCSISQGIEYEKTSLLRSTSHGFCCMRERHPVKNYSHCQEQKRLGRRLVKRARERRGFLEAAETEKQAEDRHMAAA